MIRQLPAGPLRDLGSEAAEMSVFRRSRSSKRSKRRRRRRRQSPVYHRLTSGFTPRKQSLFVARSASSSSAARVKQPGTNGPTRGRSPTLAPCARSASAGRPTLRRMSGLTLHWQSEDSQPHLASRSGAVPAFGLRLTPSPVLYGLLDESHNISNPIRQ